ncbi:Peptidoglycan-binding LysM domain-containing protein [Rhynchospora pubera]|uniref:Peptidoglycan-binding LysM domain-containing protein n=1 Tax=Rhynchospora pubera TaxID=906938 RepID=A0AAV8E856_9POAL|nr:Peptidoglycan-binding LysM domain-containing protein [Rhynchospora pubera]
MHVQTQIFHEMPFDGNGEREHKGGCQLESDNLYDGVAYKSNELKVTTNASSPSTSSSFSSSSSSSPTNAFDYIRHEVCKLDTLAGIAIKYGVEISDVRRLNGLATDLQMFAHKTLRIPFQGRHLYAYQDTGHDATKRHTEHGHCKEMIDDFKSFGLKPPCHSKISPTIGPLQGDYKRPPIPKKTGATHKSSSSLCLRDEDLLLITKPALKQHRRSRSLIAGERMKGDGHSNRSVRQRQRANVSPDVSSVTGTVPMISSLLVDKLLTVRKSSSTSSLQDFAIASSYSLLVSTSKWNLLTDTFALPSFDGFRNPIATWINKSAQD